MKVTLDTDQMTDSEKGEVLRYLVFNEELLHHGSFKYRRKGGFSTFEVNKGFERINPNKYPQLYKFFVLYSDHVYAFESKKIVAMGFHEKDYELLIWIKGEEFAYWNENCWWDDWEEINIEEKYEEKNYLQTKS